MTKEERKSIFENTIKIVQKGTYISPSNNEVVIQNTEEMVNGTVYYSSQANVDFDKINRFDTKINVINKDCLLCAKDLLDEGKTNVAVLNMASYKRPGGGVLAGSAAQEENLFRRTNLFKSLYMFDSIGAEFGIMQKKGRYPLEYNFGGIFTPHVTVFRDGEDTMYEYRDEPYEVNVISVAAIKHPKLDKDGNLVPWVEDTLKNKVRQIFSIALENGITNLVLSAFGCGAYGTPPSEMARIFDETLKGDKFRGAFENVIFAIIDDHNAFNGHNPNGNYKPFAEKFS